MNKQVIKDGWMAGWMDGRMNEKGVFDDTIAVTDNLIIDNTNKWFGEEYVKIIENIQQ